MAEFPFGGGDPANSEIGRNSHCAGREPESRSILAGLSFSLYSEKLET